MPISVARAARRNQQNGGSHRKPFTHECRLEAREARSVGVSRSRGHRAEGVCGLICALRSALYIPTLVCGQCLFESLLHACVLSFRWSNPHVVTVQLLSIKYVRALFTIFDARRCAAQVNFQC